MRRSVLIAAGIIAVTCAAALHALPQRPALVSQVQFIDVKTGMMRNGGDVVQTFEASGTATGAKVPYTTYEALGVRRRVTGALLEVERGPSPGEWHERTLATDTVTLVHVTKRGTLSFEFPPVTLHRGKLYALRIESELPSYGMALMRDEKIPLWPATLYQAGHPLQGSLAFSIAGAPSSDLYGVMRDGANRPMADPAVIVGLLVALAALAGLLIGEAPSPEAEEGRRVEKGARRGPRADAEPLRGAGEA